MGRLFQKIILISIIALSACASGSRMTRSDFDSIDIGTPATDVVKKYGDPYSIKPCKNGTQTYEYIERIPVGGETVEENKYYLIIKDGEVISKRYNYELPPAYDIIYDEDPNDVPN